MDVLGKGAQGRIYLATDLVTHDRVAIKLVSFIYFICNEFLDIYNPWVANCFSYLIDGEIEQKQI